MTKGPYYYETRTSWNEKRRGVITFDRLPPISVSSPPEFEGEAGFWSPEHLLVASAESCLMMTFLAIAEKAGLPIHSYQSWALGKLDSVQGQGLRFTKLTIRPAIKLGRKSLPLTRAGRISVISRVID